METANVGYSYHLPSGGWNYKIRNTLSQFSDLFSEFNKYIAPAYHHDRCERSAPMRVYSMHKGEFVMVFIAFFACFGLGVFIGLAGPPPTKTSPISADAALDNGSAIYRGPFHIHSPALGSRSQQLWLYAEILTNNEDEEIFDKSFQISLSIEGILSDHTTVTIVHENQATNRTLHLHCIADECLPVLVLHLGSLEYTHYVLNAHLYGLAEFHKRYIIRDIVFTFRTYNPAFTVMEEWFRFIFLITTFGVAFWFAHTLRKYANHDWSIEQQWVSILLPLLLLYNDPLYPLRYVSGGCFAPLVDTVFQNNFLAALMMSWLVLSHGLRQNERGFVSFYLIKVLIVGFVWSTMMVITIWQKYYGYLDPTFNYKITEEYYITKVLFLIGLVIYFVYLMFLTIKSYSDLRNMPFFDIRLRCLSIMITTVLTVLLLLFAFGWGAGVLQDHWASQPGARYATSAPFMALYGLFNFKMYTLAYLFSPSGGSVHENGITKDNPAFSMINDSDEDVIYGSDEESRRPLNAHHIANEQL